MCVFIPPLLSRKIPLLWIQSSVSYPDLPILIGYRYRGEIQAPGVNTFQYNHLTFAQSERTLSVSLSLTLGPDPLFAELSLMRLYQWECWKEISIESVWSAILLKQWCDKHPIEKSEEMREYSSEREKFRQLIRKLFQQVSCCLYSSHSNFV